MARVAIQATLRRYSLVFWDFDGVIKESVEVKTLAYVELFAQHGSEVAERVRLHHESNGGMSRFEKIPLYLSWTGIAVTNEQIERCCNEFAAAVRQRVIDSPWVPGALEYLRAQCREQRFVLFTATPQAEIEDIVRSLGIADCFWLVYGAPTSKPVAIAGTLQRWGCANSDAVVIGDSLSDYQAACAARLDFVLRNTPLNRNLQVLHRGPRCNDFLHG